MNEVFSDMMGKSLLVYLDDLLVMSSSIDEHLLHLEAVLQRLQKHALRPKLKKCEFLQTQIKFLGHIISEGTIAVDPSKVVAIQNWPRPKNVKELMGFLGTANYLRKHIRGYSILAGPLTDLTGKARAAAFDWSTWTEETVAAFEAIKRAVVEAALLAIPDLNGKFEVRADASIDGFGAILLQNGRPVAFLSRKLTSAERNYTTGEQELLALVCACKEWRCYLESSEPFTLITDHQPLTYLLQQEVLSRRQARWLEFLSRFKFTIEYRPGVENPADPLSRKPVVALLYARYALGHAGSGWLAVSTRAQQRRAQGLPDPPPPAAVEQVKAPKAAKAAGRKRHAPRKVAQPALPPPPGHPSLLTADLKAAYSSDPNFANPQFLDKLVKSGDGLWRLKGSNVVVVPAVPELRTRIITLMHDAAWAGHVGITKTLELVGRMFYWQAMRTDVRHHVTHCDACQRNKHSNQVPAGLLKSLSIPGWRWESMSMDLVVKLPVTPRGFDSMCVFVDRLSKMVHIVPCKESMKTAEFARLYRDNIWKLHGLPRTIVSDRGGHWNSAFWDEVCRLVGVRQAMSTAFHPQSDGQTEIYNKVVQQTLRHYVSPLCDDWDDHLACVEFAINNSWNESIQNTPFFVNYGQHPLTPVLADGERGSPPTAQAFTEAWQAAVAKARRCMQAAQQRQQRYANKHLREVQYKVGDSVLLSTKNLQLKTGVPSRKLLPRFIGPFTVKDLVSDGGQGTSAVELALPHTMRRLHPWFHVSLLKPYLADSKIPHLPPPPVDWLDEEPMYAVEAILDHRDRVYGRGRRREYLVKWEGYGPEHTAWEPLHHLMGDGFINDALREYHIRAGLEALPCPDLDSGADSEPDA
jgi:hypothetical protein